MLYEDDGDGHRYEKGRYLLTTYKARRRGGKVTVEIAAQEGMMTRPRRTVNVEVVTSRGVARSSGREKDRIAAEVVAAT